MKRISSLIILTVCISAFSFKGPAQKDISGKPKISFTFDDGSISDMPGYKLETWNQLLLDELKKNDLKAILFACGSKLSGEKGKYVMSSWDKAGHKIANHTFSHPYFNSKKITLEAFEGELLKNDSIIRSYKNFYPYFRFPFLKEGDTPEKITGFREFLKKQDYRNGYVTIDASDWYIDGRLVNKLKTDPKADLSGYKKYYIEHLYNRALFYDSLATQLTNRKISHTLLLHHNLAAALFLDDLITYFKSKGWEVRDADKAYLDPVFDNQPANVPAGESLIWAMAKQSGKFEKVLRYPGEDGEYEKTAMDKLGL